jgi:hypothetical protein
MQQRLVNQAERAEHADDNPALSDVIERNIRTIIQLRLKAAHARGVQDRLADVITAFSGRFEDTVAVGPSIILTPSGLLLIPSAEFPRYRLRGCAATLIATSPVCSGDHVLVTQCFYDSPITDGVP